MSGKLRITLWIALMMLIAAATTLTFVIIADSSALSGAPGGRLSSVINHNAREVEIREGLLDFSDVDAYQNGVFTLCTDSEGNFLYGATYNNIDFTTPFKDGQVQSEDVDGLVYYIFDTYLETEQGGIWLRGTIAGTDTSDVMNTIIVTAGILLPVLTVAAASGGWLIAKKTLEPVDKIAGAASSITDGNDLSRRIDLDKGPPEMKKLAQTFNNMISRLEKSFNAEKQFTADASHELRTPLTVITAQCSRARKKARTREDFLSSIDVIERNVKKMNDLTQRLLQITRLEQGTDKYKLHEADLSEFVAVTVEDLATQKPQGFTVLTDIQPGITFRFDLTLMSGILCNLVENAFRYGREKGTVAVYLKRINGRIILKVRDDGIGISPEEKDKIWLRFWQSDASRTGQQGTGLGLFMVKQAVEYHGGLIRVDSEPGRGSEFTIDFGS